jgi:hypothetical protein
MQGRRHGFYVMHIDRKLVHLLSLRADLGYALHVLQVQYTALPHYEDKFEDFKADTVVLRRRFTPDGESHMGLCVLASYFSFLTRAPCSPWVLCFITTLGAPGHTLFVQYIAASTADL